LKTHQNYLDWNYRQWKSLHYYRYCYCYRNQSCSHSFHPNCHLTILQSSNLTNLSWMMNCCLNFHRLNRLN
jgi:hypothetical protein